MYEEKMSEWSRLVWQYCKQQIVLADAIEKWIISLKAFRKSHN